MQNLITTESVLNLVQLGLQEKPFNRQVASGFYVRNKKRNQIFVSIGEKKLITVYSDGELLLFLKASEHENINQAHEQAKKFIDQIYQVLDSNKIKFS